MEDAHAAIGADCGVEPPVQRVEHIVTEFEEVLKKLSVWRPYLPLAAALGAALILVFGLTIMALTIRRSAHAIAERLPSVGASGGGLEANIKVAKEDRYEEDSVPRLAPPAPPALIAPSSPTGPRTLARSIDAPNSR